MNYRHDPKANGMTQARNLLATAAQEVDRLEMVASQAFCQLTALTGILTQLEKLALSHEPEAAEAAALELAMVCREAEGLIRYLDSREWGPPHAISNSNYRGRPLAALSNTSR